MASPFEPGREEFQAMADAAAQLIRDYTLSLPERRIMPETTSAELRARLQGDLPRVGLGFAELWETLSGVIVPGLRHNGHPRFFGYVASPGTAITALGDFVAAAINSNVTSWRSAPAGAELEHLTVNWIKEMIGFPADAAGLFVSGGSMANFCGLAAARSARAGIDITRSGAQAVPRRMRIYASEEGHSCIAKAAGLLGIGTDNVCLIATGPDFRMDVADLERRIRQDLADGCLPLCVVASAGTVNTGAFDPIGEIAAVAREFGLWLHVDGAYGGFAALAPSTRHHFAEVATADSIALDPHKWLYASMGCGCVLYRDPQAARAAFAHHAEYTKVLGFERDEAFAFWDFGPELSRPFRALPIWMLIRSAGTDAIAAAIEGNIQRARYLERLVRDSRDFEMLAPVEASIFCFRHRPHAFTGDLNEWNESVLIQLQRDGSSYLSNAMLRGQFALRGCVLNYRTTDRDMEILLDDVRKAAARIG